MKALGRGWSRDVGWLDVETVRADGEHPETALHGPAAAFAARRGVVRLHLALTHTAEIAAAQVIVESE